jgi:hypothetical protein
MLVKFATRHGQLLMHGEPAVRLIQLGGHSGAVPGAVLYPDLAEFLVALRRGLELHGDELSPPPPEETSDDEVEPRERPVPLRRRALPLLDLIQTAIKRESDLMWEQA